MIIIEHDLYGLVLLFTVVLYHFFCCSYELSILHDLVLIWSGQAKVVWLRTSQTIVTGLALVFVIATLTPSGA
jgi:hypothetical protein